MVAQVAVRCQLCGEQVEQEVLERRLGPQGWGWGEGRDERAPLATHQHWHRQWQRGAPGRQALALGFTRRAAALPGPAPPIFPAVAPHKPPSGLKSGGGQGDRGQGTAWEEEGLQRQN